MLAISLWQPWASAWISGIKIHETRHWCIPRKVGGRILVHAAKKMVGDLPAETESIIAARFGGDWRETLPRGALVGDITLGRCHPTDAAFRAALSPQELALGNFADGRFAWEGKYARAWNPIPYRGAQGFFAVPHTVSVHAEALTQDPAGAARSSVSARG